MPATEIKIYRAGTNDVLAITHSLDGASFTKNLDLPDGTHQIELTARAVGFAESARSAPQTVVVGANTAPTITSHYDWQEITANTIALTILANAGESIRVYFDGVQRGVDLTANGSGIAGAAYNLNSSAVIGIDTFETITTCRVIGGVLSHPATLHLVCTYGRTAISGATTLRTLMTSLALSLNRYKYVGFWDNEMVSCQPGPHGTFVPARQAWRYTKSYNDTVGTFCYLNTMSSPAMHAPGYINAAWLRNHLDRILNETAAGMVKYHVRLTGDNDWPAIPMWFDVAVALAMAYFRGDKSVYADHKAQMLSILSNLSPNFIDGNGLVRQGSYYTGRLRNHGWQGVPVDHGASWYAAHNGDTTDGVGVSDVPYWPETEATARWIYATNLLVIIANQEGDTATASTLTGYLNNFKAGVASQITDSSNNVYGANLVKAVKFPYNNFFWPTGSDGNVGWSATAFAVAVDAFSTSGQRSAVATAFLNALNITNGRTGGNGTKASGEYLSPLYCGSMQYSGVYSSFNEVMQVVAAQYHHTYCMGPVVHALAQANATFARSVGEDVARLSIHWFQHAVINCLGIFYQHNMTSGHWNHMGSHWGPMAHNAHSWMCEADDKHADLGPLTLNGTAGSYVDLDTPFGHRVVGVQITAGQSCTAVIEVRGMDARNGLNGFVGVTTWPPSASYDVEQIMASIAINGTSASKTTGFKPAACYTGGRIRIRVISVTGTPPASFSVVLKQSRISPTFVADATQGFTDNFTSNRFSEYDVLQGSIGTCSVVTRSDRGPANIDLAPLTRTMFKTTAAGWTSLVQKNTLFTDGAAMIYQAMRSDATVNISGAPSIGCLGSIFLRVSADRQTYIRVDSDAADYYFNEGADDTQRRYTVTEMVNGAVFASTVVTADTTGAALYGPPGADEYYHYAKVRGNLLTMAAWTGGTPIPFRNGMIGYGGGPMAAYTIQHASLQGAGAVGFGIYGPCEIEAFKCCGMDQPLPPGFILDTGLNVPNSEAHLPSAFVNGEVILPASDTSCLRNEWGHQVTGIVTGFNPRWSY